MSHLTTQHIESAFKVFDTDGDGKIGANDWERILSILS